MAWRTYDPVADRPAAQRILRQLLRRGPVPFTIHPGDWDWWCFHDDPRFTTEFLIDDDRDGSGDRRGADSNQRLIAAFGCPVARGGRAREANG